MSVPFKVCTVHELHFFFILRIGRIAFQRAVTPWLWYDSVCKFFKGKEVDAIHQIWRQFADGPLKV